MFNLILKVKLKRYTIVATKLNFHSHARGNNNILNDFQQYKDTLASEFHIPTDLAGDIIIRSKLLTISLEQIKRKCKLFQKHDLKVTDVENISKLLSLKLVNLEHRINLLQELGAKNLNDNILIKFYHALRLKEQAFKEFVGVSSEVDLVHTFFETSFPKSYERPPLKIAMDDLTILELRALLIPYYAMWRFEISAETVRTRPLFWKTLLCKSLNMTNNLVDYLLNELGWDMKKLKSCFIVTRYDLNNIRMLHEEVKSISELSFKEASWKCPIILRNNVNEVKNTLNFCRQKDIPESSLLKCLQILAMPHEIVMERINTMLSNPTLIMFRNHPRFLQMVIHFKRLEKRFERIRQMNFRCISLNALIVSPWAFEKIYAHGLDISNKSDVEALLNYEFPTIGTALIEKLKENQNWLHVPLPQIFQSLQFLKQHFSKDEICDNIQIILYHASAVKRTWKFVQEGYKNCEGLQFTTSQYLALCLYHLELKHHFSGDGVLSSKSTKDGKTCTRDESKFQDEYLSGMKL